MKKKCFCLAACMLSSLLCLGYCQAEELTTLNSSQQAVGAQKKPLQNDNATSVYPKETTKHLLPNKRGDLLHIAFEKGYIGKGVKLEPMVLQTPYVIEVIVNPSGQQVAYAGILSNHMETFQGFGVEQDPSAQNTYCMFFGDGTAWCFSPKFKLKEGVWNYVAVVCNDMNTIKVYVDGSLVGTATPKNTIKNSPMPLQIGNSGGGNYPFNGGIAELRIANFPLSEEDIAMRWSKLKLSLSKMQHEKN